MEAGPRIIESSDDPIAHKKAGDAVCAFIGVASKLARVRTTQPLPDEGDVEDHNENNEDADE